MTNIWEVVRTRRETSNCGDCCAPRYDYLFINTRQHYFVGDYVSPMQNNSHRRWIFRLTAPRLMSSSRLADRRCTAGRHHRISLGSPVRAHSSGVVRTEQEEPADVDNQSSAVRRGSRNQSIVRELSILSRGRKRKRGRQ